jgi:hypothetical protein
MSESRTATCSCTTGRITSPTIRPARSGKRPNEPPPGPMSRDSRRTVTRTVAGLSADSHEPVSGQSQPISRERAREMERRGDREGDSPQPPRQAGGPKSRANGTSPRAVARREAEAEADTARERRHRRNQRELAYQRGEIGEAQLVEMNRRDAPLDELPARSESPAWLGS